MSDPTDWELRVQARDCPFIRAALATGDTQVIESAMTMHPPSKCAHAAQIPP